MRSCNHEEADTLILVHVKDALDKGGKSVLVRTVDTDVLVVLIAQFHTLSLTWPGLSFWVAFGMRKNSQLLPVNTICEYLGEQKCLTLPFLYAFTECDTMSAFLGRRRQNLDRTGPDHGLDHGSDRGSDRGSDHGWDH